MAPVTTAGSSGSKRAARWEPRSAGCPFDDLYAPEADLAAVVDALAAAAAAMYPTLGPNPDYSAVVTDAHRRRLLAHVEDARRKGAAIVEVNQAGEDLGAGAGRKMAPTIIVGATPEMTVMQEEIFGPLLPVIGYRTVAGAVAAIAAWAPTTGGPGSRPSPTPEPSCATGPVGQRMAVAWERAAVRRRLAAAARRGRD